MSEFTWSEVKCESCGWTGTEEDLVETVECPDPLCIELGCLVYVSDGTLVPDQEGTDAY